MKKYLLYAFIIVVVVFLAVFAFKKHGAQETTQATVNVVPAPQILITKPDPEVAQAPDPRLATLSGFLTDNKCVDAPYAQNYLDAADSNGLDWRLMPALSIKEESCYRNAYKNNLWGWESGAKQFSSIPAGIDFLADNLNNLHYYQGKTTDQKLRTYNNHPGYAESVESIMEKIAPEK